MARLVPFAIYGGHATLSVRQFESSCHFDAKLSLRGAEGAATDLPELRLEETRNTMKWSAHSLQENGIRVIIDRLYGTARRSETGHEDAIDSSTPASSLYCNSANGQITKGNKHWMS